MAACTDCNMLVCRAANSGNNEFSHIVSRGFILSPLFAGAWERGEQVFFSSCVGCTCAHVQTHMHAPSAAPSTHPPTHTHRQMQAQTNIKYQLILTGTGTGGASQVLVDLWRVIPVLANELQRACEGAQVNQRHSDSGLLKPLGTNLRTHLRGREGYSQLFCKLIEREQIVENGKSQPLSRKMKIFLLMKAPKFINRLHSSMSKLFQMQLLTSFYCVHIQHIKASYCRDNLPTSVSTVIHSSLYVHDPQKVEQVQCKSRTPERPFIESGPGMS